MLGALDELPKPLVAGVNGPAYGGVGLLAVRGIAVAADAALLGLAETRLGLIPAAVGPYVVARPGEAAARRAVLSGRRLGPPIAGAVIEASVAALVARREDGEARAGLDAFFARRPAPWA